MGDVEGVRVRYLSVCSGIEAASVAWHSLGWKPLAFSEIELFPRAVLAHHYPDVPCHGDFTTLRDMPFIVDADILVGGTPCQAFSVAGLRNSLSDERGNLSLEFVRLADAIDDLRTAGGRDPSIIVWENVPGVLSVKDNAFGCFLAALAGDASPYDPPRGKWTNAGVVDGPARTVAWRILDAQYFGLAQRRRRVFVVASAREGFDPAAVLLEFEGLRRDTPPRRETRETTAHSTAPCLTSSGRGVERTGDTRGQDPVVAVMEDENGLQHTVGTLCADTHPGAYSGQDAYTGRLVPQVVTHSLRAEGFDASENGTGRGTPLVPVAFQSNQSFDSGNNIDISPTLRVGSNGQGQPPAIAFSSKDDGADATADLSPTLRALGAYDANGGGQMAVAYPLQEVGKRTGTSTTDPRAGIGIGQDGDAMFTLQAGAQHGVAVQASQSGVRLNDTVGTLDANYGSRRHNGVMVPVSKGDAAPCVASSMSVRRLTVVECSRLQGFPDDYLTQVTWRGKCPPADGVMYKALGNSMAVPCMRWIGQRIAAQFKRDQ